MLRGSPMVCQRLSPLLTELTLPQKGLSFVYNTYVKTLTFYIYHNIYFLKNIKFCIWPSLMWPLIFFEKYAN
jgi:hypothetical protein